MSRGKPAVESPGKPIHQPPREPRWKSPREPFWERFPLRFAGRRFRPVFREQLR
jgi:hypothetical protein